MPETPKPKILVVDDNQSNRALARETLEDEGYRVVVETGGAAALVAFEREAPDCILLDVRMPDTDGFAVCRRIRALPAGADVPIVFFTALRDVDTFDRALEVGGTDFLTKPVRPTELVVRVEAALALRRANAELRAHHDLFRRQREHLQRVQLQKERLVAFVVHDLKAPLGSLDLHAQLVLRDASLSPDAREAARHIRDQARQLDRMILNLLDLAKAEEGKLSPVRVPVALDVLVAEVVADQRAGADQRRVALRSEGDPVSIDVDRDLVRRMLSNLLENAVRHAPPATEVVVSVTARPAEVELRVRDHGPGVPVSSRERIFDAFAQGDAEETLPERNGRGLGLTFCKLVAEAHGARIGVGDAHPGAVFHVRFPRGE